MEGGTARPRSLGAGAWIVVAGAALLHGLCALVRAPWTRARRAARPPRALGAARVATALGVLGACAVFGVFLAAGGAARTREPLTLGFDVAPAHSRTIQFLEAPAELAEEAPREPERSRRHAIEGPEREDAAAMARAQVSSHRLDLAESWNGPRSPFGDDATAGVDAMSALGALMGDASGQAFGFGGLGVRGHGHGGRALGTLGTLGRGAIDDATVDEDEPELDTTPARPRAPPPPSPELIADRDRVDGLPLQPARGYWANTYLPGDPAMSRHLRVLRDGHPRGRPGLELARRVTDTTHALDAPTHDALALHLRADRPAVEGPSRVLVQIGLRGSERGAGRRAPARVAVVLDAPASFDAAERASTVALLEALARGAAASDAASVWASGAGGGERVALGRLTYGRVTIASRTLFDAPTGDDLPLPAVITRAAASLAGGGASVGSAVVWVVSAGASGDVEEAARAASDASADGVTTSVIALADEPPLDPVALAGEGRLRTLGSSASEAEAVVRGELEAASRAVARAIRLRVRLAPGVRLVDVLGSRRLDAAQSERVRERERSIDRSLSSEVGIVADRGDDEDGVQIVIPAFYAGDDHTILLDVVVPGPGPVVEVRARYKDLVRLGNGAAVASLALGRGRREPSPAELRVAADLHAHDLARALADAGERIESDPGEAWAVVDRSRARIDAARDRLPALGAMADVRRDLELAAAYARAIEASVDAATRADLAASLSYASRRRLLTPFADLTPGDPR